MFSLLAPTEAEARRLIEAQRGLPFSYPGVGASRQGVAPPGFRLARRRARLGTGKPVFERARAAVRSWEMFRMPWVRLHGADAPPEAGATVVVAARAGLWVLNACRVVYVLDEPGTVGTFGFAYGTLPHHVERGEERFTVQWNHADDTVWYDLLSFSRPGHPLVRSVAPLARKLQARFAVDSMNAMGAACLTGHPVTPRL